MALKLRQAGLFGSVAEEDRLQEYRIRQLGTTIAASGVGVVVGAVVGSGAALAVLMGVLGFVVGATRSRAGVDRAIGQRRDRMRIEIYTVNQLLAMRLRVGGGVVQAVQQLCDRGSGEVVEELSEALRLHRSGMSASEAFNRIATATPETHSARTYALLAAAEERGADLGEALLALSEDVREGRREAMRRQATKRRAAMLIPTIAILAPVMLVFVAAPLPSIVFGSL
jgi:tight adherence protein C